MELNIPETNQVLYPGSIVVIPEYPYTKWIVCHGWYTYREQQINGWYFKSINDGSILSLSNVQLDTITIVSPGTHPHPHPHPHPFPPGPGPRPPMPVPSGFGPHQADQLRRALVTVDSIRQRDALDDGNLPNGKLCRVNNVNGRVKYYAYDVSTSTWIEQPIDFMTESAAEDKFMSKEEFTWDLMSDTDGQ